MNFWMSVAGSWALLLVQTLTFVSFRRHFKTKSLSSNEASLFSLSLILFGTPAVIAAGLLVGAPYWLMVWLLSVTVGVLLAHHWQPRTNLYDAEKNDWSFISIISLVSWGLFVSLSKPEGSVDGMLYHGVTLSNILNRRGLWEWSVGNAYSYYTDLAMIPAAQFSRLTPSAQLDDFVGVPYLVLIFLLLQVVIGSIIANKQFVSLISFLVITTPVIWIQARIMYVDLIYAAALCVSIYVCSVKYSRCVLIPVVGYSSIAALMGTKMSGIGIAAVLFFVLTTKLILERGIKLPLRLRFLVLVFTIGGLSFYIRNFSLWKNPFYPITYNVGSFKLPGLIDLSVFASDGDRVDGLFSPLRVLDFVTTLLHGVQFGVQKMDYDPRVGGFGRTPLFIFLLVVLFIVSTFLLRKMGNNSHQPFRLDPQKKIDVSLIMISSLLLVTLSLQPNSLNSRYVIGPYLLLTAIFIVATLRYVPNLGIDSGFIGPMIFLFIIWSFRWNETNLHLGKSDIDYSSKMISEFNTGVTGGSWQQGNAFTWVPKDSCVSIYVDKGPGVNTGGMTAYSIVDLFPYGFYGNRLCNQVTFVPGGIPRNKTELSALSQSDYLVTFIENKTKVTSFLSECIKREFFIDNAENGYTFSGQHAQVVSELDLECAKKVEPNIP